VTLVQDAQRDGARLAKACQVMGINVRTYYRWVAEGEVTADRRPDADRPEPANKLSPEERKAIVKWTPSFGPPDGSSKLGSGHHRRQAAWISG